MIKYETIDINRIIKSETVKNWVNTNDHRFTYKEIITLIFNSDLTLKDKYKIFIDILYKEKYFKNDFECTDEELKYAMKEIRRIVDNLRFTKTCILGQYNRVLVFNDLYEEQRIVGSLQWLKELVRKGKIKIDNEFGLTVSVVNTQTSSVIAYITLNKELDPVHYILDGYKAKNESKLQNCYVNIPIVFNIGEVVKIAGSESDKQYVVCYDNIIPEELMKKSDFFDSCVTVIPEETLQRDSKIKYKEQIEIILKSRIRDMENKKEDTEENDEEKCERDLDIISKYHEHIPITLVERVR